eukprot:5782864-Amphidinium_carterae.1
MPSLAPEKADGVSHHPLEPAKAPTWVASPFWQARSSPRKQFRPRIPYKTKKQKVPRALAYTKILEK